MVRFNELGVTRDGGHLIIDVSVRDLTGFKDSDGNPIVTLGKVYVVNDSQYADGSAYAEDYVYRIEYGKDEAVTSQRIVLDEDDVPGLRDDLLFVIVETSGEPEGDYKGESPTVGVTFWQERLYAAFMDAMREIALNKDTLRCQPPRWLIDLHLRKHALEAAVESGDFALACKWWTEFFRPRAGEGGKKCKCHE